MTTQETAIKYGVPMPETCDKLQWCNTTFLYWLAYETKKGLQYALYAKNRLNYVLVESNFEILFAKQKGSFIPAPQMHEIAPLLPDKYIRLRTDDNEVFFDNGKLAWAVLIENHHYAQAYAELYLKLKEKNLLTTQLNDRKTKRTTKLD